MPTPVLTPPLWAQAFADILTTAIGLFFALLVVVSLVRLFRHL